MRTVKLIFIFILCVGNVVLLFNAGTIFGKTDRIEIFTQVLKDTIDSDEFYRSDEAKKIVDKYNELGKKAQEALRLAEDAVIRANNAARIAETAAQRAEVAETYKDAEAAAQEVSDALSTVEDIAKQYPSEDIDRVKIRVKAAVIRAEEVIKKNKEQQKNKIDQIKAEILELVKKKDFDACQAHFGWNELGQTDRNTVDCLLRTAQYKKGKAYYDRKVIKKYTNAQVNQIMRYINGLNFEDFKTWADLEAVKNKIIRIRTETEHK